ncbi:MAG: metalloregulator ArsR/SmtB family transcription factor [Proteobacteria bacterium]|nr:metalloregulator ArsR/SmtB family transcription factor [Pseudomonadota bacterium]
MVKYKSEPLDSVFSALADPTRRAILARLATGHSSVGELAEPFDISLPAVSRHLRVLRNAGLITRHKDGRVRRCTLNAAPLRAASDWIGTYRQFWEGQFDSLAEYLGRTQDKAEQNPDDQTLEPLQEDE